MADQKERILALILDPETRDSALSALDTLLNVASGATAVAADYGFPGDPIVGAPLDETTVEQAEAAFAVLFGGAS